MNRYQIWCTQQVHSTQTANEKKNNLIVYDPFNSRDLISCHIHTFKWEQKQKSHSMNPTKINIFI